jgi:hypothetical protein
MPACILTLNPGGERHAGCWDIFGGKTRAIQVEVTLARRSKLACEFGGPIDLASRLCCDVTDYKAVVTFAGLVRDNLTNIVK